MLKDTTLKQQKLVFWEEKIPLAQSRKIKSCQMKNGKSNQRENEAQAKPDISWK